MNKETSIIVWLKCVTFTFFLTIHCPLSIGNVVLHYKRYATDKWLPDANDPSTYLSDVDKYGILVFKVRVMMKMLSNKWLKWLWIGLHYVLLGLIPLFTQFTQFSKRSRGCLLRGGYFFQILSLRRVATCNSKWDRLFEAGS